MPVQIEREDEAYLSELTSRGKEIGKAKKIYKVLIRESQYLL